MLPLPTLYFHPISTTSRPILMFAAEHGLALDCRAVDLFTGEQLGAEFTAVNPNQAVPVLVEGDFTLTESSAILKYLADRVGSQAYPQELQARARVNAAMDWFNTGFSRDAAYGVAYPQILPKHRRPSDEAQAAQLAWSRPLARRWLAVLNDSMLADGRAFVLGEQITLADYLGLGLATLMEAVNVDFAAWPHVQRWLAGLKARPAYARTHDAFESFLAATAAERASASL